MTQLLEGRQLAIRPHGFDATHARGGTSHRLRADSQKWQPFLVGETIERQRDQDGAAIEAPSDES